MIKEYLDFELHFSVEDGHLKVDLVTRPTAVNLLAPISVMPEADFRRFDTFSSAEIRTYGKELYDSVFCKELAQKLEAFLSRRRSDQGIRVGVELLPSIPSNAVWEALCQEVEPDVRFLALDPRTPIIRVPRAQREVHLRKLTVPLRILVVLASPSLLETIDGKLEKATFEESLGWAQAKGLLQIEYLGFDDRKEANFDTLQATIAKQDIPFDIVHIIGHGILERGDEAEIALVDPDSGDERLVDAESFSRIFTSRFTMLVVLQSCHSGEVDASTPTHSGLAEKLVAFGVPAVLAMRQRVDQDVARHFTKKLYTQWIETKCPLEDALTQARVSVEHKFAERAASWALPVLYRHPAIPLELVDEVPAVDSPLRVVDAALPEFTRVGRETELVVLIRAPNARGLREILQSAARDYEVTPGDVRSMPKFEARFPIDASGRLMPTAVTVRLESDDFTIRTPEATLEIRPDGEGVLYDFAVTPLREGRAKISVTVVDPQQTNRVLARMPLRTRVRSGETFETDIDVIDEELVVSEERQNSQAARLQMAVDRSREHLDYLAASARGYTLDIRELYRLLRRSEARGDDEGRRYLLDYVEFNREFLHQVWNGIADYDIGGESHSRLFHLAQRLDESVPRLDDRREALRWNEEMSRFLHELAREIGPDRLDRILQHAAEQIGISLRCRWCGLRLPDDWPRRWWRYWPDSPYSFSCPSCGADWPWFLGTLHRDRLVRSLDASRGLARICEDRANRLKNTLSEIDHAPEEIRPDDTGDLRAELAHAETQLSLVTDIVHILEYILERGLREDSQFGLLSRLDRLLSSM